MSYEVVPKARCVRAIAVFVLLGALVTPLAAAADPPTPLNVLFVANGWCSQEDDIENHFLDLGYNVTRIKDYKVKSTTSFAAYDLIVLTESAPLVSAAGLNAIKASGKPVLVVESWTFLYAYRLGLTTSPLARLSDGDTVTSLVDGHTAFTSRVGTEALVHQTASLVFGVNPAHAKSNVVPLYQSTGCMSGVSLFVDYEHKIGVTGISDTASYTVDAWKMFDILVQQIVPAPRPYATLDEVTDAFIYSGLYTFVEEVQEDLRQQPGSWTFEEAEKEAWLITTQWRLGEFWDYMTMEIGNPFGISAQLPSFHTLYVPPQRPHGDVSLHPGHLPDDPPYDEEHEYWFMGQYWESTFPYEIVLHPFQWPDSCDGTDLGLGINVKLNGRDYYYLGDTWDAYSKRDSDPNNTIRMWSDSECGDTGDLARCDDMIVVSTDAVPQNGVSASPVFVDSAQRWKPITIPGVHKYYSSQLLGYWGGQDWEPAFTVPTGAATAMGWKKKVVGWGIEIYLPVPMAVVWYGTAIHPGQQFPSVDIDSTDPQRRPTSWVGCSFDGTTFYSCYTTISGEVVPFSTDSSPPDNAPAVGDPSSPLYFPYPYPAYPATGFPARFIQVTAVNVTASDFESICPDGFYASEMCEFYDSGGGLLLYGSGRPYRKSGLFLAFIAAGDFGHVNPDTDKPIVNYWTGDGWSLEEEDAASLTGEPPCDTWRRPDHTPISKTHGCWPIDSNLTTTDWDVKKVFGELSARLIRSDDPTVAPQVVLLNNNEGNVFAWKAPLSAPWGGDFAALDPDPTLTFGYGPYIIDAFSDDTYPGNGPDGGVVLWHTISVWNGTEQTPYGVYTGKEVIPW
ncbi:MAG: hypothetical protein M0R80_15180 [Proteobacteria bacterium]|nr:hypothetical protein [Pseudomonadota bacterium]